jgi:hypothetical protein
VSGMWAAIHLHPDEKAGNNARSNSKEGSGPVLKSTAICVMCASTGRGQCIILREILHMQQIPLSGDYHDKNKFNSR